MNLNTFTKILRMKKRIQFLSLLLSLISFLSIGQIKNDTILKPMKLSQPNYLKAGDSIAIVAPAGILINKEETDAHLLTQVDAVLGADLPDDSQQRSVGYSQVGMGAQILRDLGVGKIRLMGAPVKYNALEGFGLEVVEFVEPGAVASGQ